MSLLRHLRPGAGLHHKVIIIGKVKLVSTIKLHSDVADTVIGQSSVVVVEVAVAVKSAPFLFWSPGSFW